MTTGVFDGSFANNGNNPGGSQREQGLSDTEANSQSRTGIVPTSWADCDFSPSLRQVSTSHGLHGLADLRKDDSLGFFQRNSQGLSQDFAPVDCISPIHVARSRGVGAVGAQTFQPDSLKATADSPTQPVVGQAYCRDLPCVLRLIVCKPAQFRDRKRGDGDEARSVGPPTSPSFAISISAFKDQLPRGLGASGVIPQKRRADDLTSLIQADHSVLLPAHAERAHVIQSASRAHGLEEGIPPRLRVDFTSIGVRCTTLSNDLSASGVVDNDLA